MIDHEPKNTDTSSSIPEGNKDQSSVSHYEKYNEALDNLRGLYISSSQVMNELKKEVDKQTSDLKLKIFEIKKDSKDIKDELEHKIEGSKLKVVETLGIFVALFTFISIEFQVFRSYENTIAISGLTLIILGSLTFFVIILDFVLNVNLSFLKTKKKSGLIESSLITMRNIMGVEETVEFYWFKPSTWGQTVRIKTLPLISLSILLIFIGVFLFVRSPEVKNFSESINNIENKNKIIEEKIFKIEDGKMVLDKKIDADLVNISEKKELESRINTLQSILTCLKIKGYFSVKCF